jgi:hypothetical protein
VTVEGRKRDAFGGRGLPQGGDPDDDPMGTVRRSPDGKLLAIMWPSPPHPSRWHVIDAIGAVGYELGERLHHWPIVGVVPWSPAAGAPLDGSLPTPTALTRVTAPQVRAGREVERAARVRDAAPKRVGRRREGEPSVTVTDVYPGAETARVSSDRL